MSESDDTDVLILIPPDFFTVKSIHSKNSSCNTINSITTNCNSLVDLHAAAYPEDELTIKNYFNYPNNNNYNKNIGFELDSINKRLHEIENFDNESTITSFNYTAAAANNINNNNNSYTNNNNRIIADDNEMIYQNFSSPQLYHSTPKYQELTKDLNPLNSVTEQQTTQLSVPLKPLEAPPPPKNRMPIITQKNDKFITEIDYFLLEKNNNESNFKSLPKTTNNNVRRSLVTADMIQNHNELYDKQKNSINGSSMEQLDQENVNNNYDQLISLSNIWGPDGQQETITIQEERMRRQVLIEFETHYKII